MATVSKTQVNSSVDALTSPVQFDRTGKPQGNGVDIKTLMAQLQALQAENERLKAAKARPVTMKVSKRALSVSTEWVASQ